jgi:dnd system-associated protein 4
MKSLFSRDHTVYWPEKYEGVVEYLKNGGIEDAKPEQILYKFNVGVIVLAACIGVQHDNKGDTSGKRKEINISTFESNGIGAYLYLIPLMANETPDLDLMRNPIGEEKAIRIFEEYCAGGLEILNEKYKATGLKSPHMFLDDILKETPFLQSVPKSSGTTDVKDVGIELF